VAPEDGSDVVFKGQLAWNHSSLDEKLVGGGVICARDRLARASKGALRSLKVFFCFLRFGFLSLVRGAKPPILFKIRRPSSSMYHDLHRHFRYSQSDY
jgi:hypothetical protein